MTPATEAPAISPEALENLKRGAELRISMTLPPDLQARILREAEEVWGRQALDMTTLSDGNCRVYVKGNKPLSATRDE